MAVTMQPCSGMGGGGTASTQKNCIDDGSGNQEEIISMCGPGDNTGNCAGLGGGSNTVYCTKAPSDMKGTAFVQKCYTRNSQGQLYSISGSGGMPQQINRNTSGYYGNPVTSADPQDFTYLSSVRPGAQALAKQQNFVAPWWWNVFGLKQQQIGGGVAYNAENTGRTVLGILGLVVAVNALLVPIAFKVNKKLDK
jgi:hypothetical protein